MLADLHTRILRSPLVSILFLIGLPLHCAIADDETETGVVVGDRQWKAINGHAWQQLDNQSKITLVTGMENGVTLLRKEFSARTPGVQTESLLDSLSGPSAVNPVDISKQIDLFYSDAADIRIPIIGAYKYCLLSMQGSTEAYSVLNELRQTYSDQQPKAQQVEPRSEEEDDNINGWDGFSPDNTLFAATRRVPDNTYLHRQDLDGSRIVVFRSKAQSAQTVKEVIGRHDFPGRVISQIEWSPDSKFLLFTTASSGGHSPWHFKTFVFCAADKSFRDVEAAIGSITSAKFRFETPDVAIVTVRKGEMPENEVKVPLAKTMQRMSLAK